MIIKRSTYEAEILKAFQSGRESKNLYNDDEQAVRIYADSKKFSLKSVPKPMILGYGTGMVRCFIKPNITNNSTQNNNSKN